MAGGTWSSQSKIRAGAYINYTAAPRTTTSIGIRGIVAIPVVLPWGVDNKLIEVKSTDLLTGEAFVKTGISLGDDTEAAQLMREALKSAHTALLYKINTGGAKATATLATDVTATARYSGAAGNSITVTVEAAPAGGFAVKTIVDGTEKDVQTITNVADFKTNDWVMIAGEGTLVATAGIPLIGGSTGAAGTYAGYFDALATTSIKWNTAAVPLSGEAENALTFIRAMREVEGSYVQAVVNNAGAPDYEGIINTMGQGYVYQNGERVEPNVFTATLAGLSAGAAIDESNTYKVIRDAVEIINPLKSSEIEEAIKEGYLVLSTRQDGKIVIEQDVNSLKSFTTDRPQDWRKNRVVRTLDDLATQIRMTFETNYIGKVDNTASGRTVLKADIVNLFKQAEAIGAIRDFDSAKDVVVEPGNEIDSVVANISVHPVDSIERLFATITLS